MKDEVRKYLADMLVSVEYVLVKSVHIKSYGEYVKSDLTKVAIERKLITVGEALSKADKLDPSLDITSKKQIISLRNRLVHSYDSIDDAFIYNILRKHLSTLHKELLDLLN